MFLLDSRLTSPFISSSASAFCLALSTSRRSFSVKRLAMRSMEDFEQRLVEVEWDDSENLVKEYVANIDVYGFNRPGLLNDVMQVLSNSTKNLISINAQPTKDKKMANIHIALGIKNLSDLTLIVDKIKMTPDVYSVKRTNA